MSIFPLLNLPEKSLNYVLRRMPLTELIGFALISQTAKNHVENLNIKMRDVLVGLEDNIRFYIRADRNNFVASAFFSFDINQVLEQPGKREFILKTSEGQTWTNPGLGVRQFLDHVLEIGHHPELSIFFNKIDCDEDTICDMFDVLALETFAMYIGNFVNIFYQKMLKYYLKNKKVQ
ncbi:F-box domain-containing protein [Caenorhabditis elegans]|uniref:F-box domain-containing protein n=1 Tax=Caenorhabditis elegans TaxID=6239 RepID=O45600_CAEEL|nr:F-box domain-containing protein [Caenorhabditis elegans]CAB07216.1 F-box domain-containing protein [Caenorhabditis elegans]|eukprot:NP_502146.1 F-box B protein [Caenorhabditis elegans]